MKTSLICLLLLAAVACAAPRAGEMNGEKRVGMAEMMREMMAEKRKEITEKMRERAEEKQDESEKERAEIAAAGVNAAVASFGGCPSGQCYGSLGEPGFIFSSCLRHEVEVAYYRHNRCYCCCDPFFDMCNPLD